MKEIRQIQKEHRQWGELNFPKTIDNPLFQLLGVQEEVGELSHAELKKAQGIRHTAQECDEMARDAVGDIIIFLMSYCTAKGWDLHEIVDETWDEVIQRDWVKFRKDNGLEEQ